MAKKVSIIGLVAHMLLMLESDATEQEIEEFLERHHPQEKQEVLEQLVQIQARIKTADNDVKH